MTGNPLARPIRVLHFVSGGFSGATQVAIDLVRASLGHTDIQPLLVLRRKRQTPATRYNELAHSGVPLETVSGALNMLSIWQLAQVCKRFQPDVLVAHGFPEHILGRHAGVLAGVPRLIHVEHNARERYSWLRLQQARWLAKRTQHIVGVSDGVKASLLSLGFPADRVMSIPNGIDLERFDSAQIRPTNERQPEIVMCARFSGQKDHLTAIHAMALLRDKGHVNRLMLAGGGKAKHLKQAQALVAALQLQDQVVFMGHCRDMPDLLMQRRIGLLSTHYEGMPLAMLEYMAAGCAVVATDVVGVKEILQHGHTGWLVPEGDAPALAHGLINLLGDDALARRLGEAARQQAVAAHGLPLMRQRYESLLKHPPMVRTTIESS
jgi:glycosyltransferase involved in cell wall biosynthesis